MLQVRRTPEWQSSVTGNKWMVCGYVPGREMGWPVRIVTRTKAEAQQVKANLKDGLDPFAGVGAREERDFRAWEVEMAG
jgi:hypothetical protein